MRQRLHVNQTITRRGILLAGGTGSRLHPITLGTSKQLLPVYNKPMIYYSLSVLILAGINEVLIICRQLDLPAIKRLFGNGDHLGMTIQYAVQNEPNGIAEAFIIGETFLDAAPVALILGDNLFYGGGFGDTLKRTASQESDSAILFGCPVQDPQRYGVAEVTSDGVVVSIEEKPQAPKSNVAVTGLYFYPNDVVKYARELKPSARGELEITDLNTRFLTEGRLQLESLGRGFAWLDMGTHGSLLEAAQFIESIENRQQYKIGCVEEAAFLNGWISGPQLKDLASKMPSGSYAEYLLEIAKASKT